MGRLYQPLLFLLARSTSDELQKQIEFLKAENELLRKRVPRQRIFLKPNERAKLLKLGKQLGPAIRQVITIVDYTTFRRWVRKEEGIHPKPGKGRPRIAKIIRELVIQMAKDTGWGYSRILGELRKLGVGTISRQTVKNILLENGIDPGPKRGIGIGLSFFRFMPTRCGRSISSASGFGRCRGRAKSLRWRLCMLLLAGSLLRLQRAGPMLVG